MNLITAIHQNNIIIADASTLINLYASGKMKELLEFLPNPVYVAQYVINEEILSIRNDEGILEKVDLENVIDNGLLKVVDIPSDTNLTDIYVELSSLAIGPGEVMCFAYATYYNCIVATDDMAAVKIIGRSGYDLPVLTTARILHESIIKQKFSQEEVSMAVQNIEKYANYYGAKQDPLYNWWKELSKK